MALTAIPPWLQSGPELFLGAAKSGAAAGQAAADALNNYDIHRQEIASHAATAAAQIGSEQQRAAASLALQKAHQEAAHQLNLAHLALSGDRLSSLNDYREQTNELRARGLDQREAAAALKDGGLIHAGNKLLGKNPDGSLKVLFDAGEGNINALDRMEYNSLLKQKAEAEQTLQKGGLSQKDSDFWKSRLDGAAKALQGIRSKYGGAEDVGLPLSYPSAPKPTATGTGPVWDTPTPQWPAWDSSLLPNSLPSAPDSSTVDYGKPEQPNGVQVLSIRQKQ